MRTVKEISEITGISVRTLHYYDEIGLLKPTDKSGAGYRLYDDRALETLQQILFFREFGLPLKEIKAVMENPAFDKSQVLQMQRKVLVAKKERLEHLVAAIDDILKGDNRMDFTVFKEEEISTLYNEMARNMNDGQRAIFASQYGSMEEFERHFMESAASQKAQKNFAKLVEWYGSKDAALEAAKDLKGSEIFSSYQRRLENIQKELAGKKGTDVHSFEIRELIGEYDFVSRQLYQMKDVRNLMLDLAKGYREDARLQEGVDSVYGRDSAAYIGEAIEAFYKR